jgi:hypothetical protein
MSRGRALLILKGRDMCMYASVNLLSDSFVTTPFLNRDPRAIEIIQVILENVLLRREKSMKDVDGNHIVELPPKVVSSLYMLAG